VEDLSLKGGRLVTERWKTCHWKVEGLSLWWNACHEFKKKLKFIL